MKTEITPERIAKLPNWAQHHFRELERQREAAVEAPRPRHCNNARPDYIPGGGGFGFVLILAFVVWLLSCSGVLSLIL